MKHLDLSRLNAIIVPLITGEFGLRIGAVVLRAFGANSHTAR